MTRDEVIEAIAAHVAALRPPHPLRIGIDGVDGVGKTTFAADLLAPLERLGRSVIRASVDHFHRPRAQRYRRGRTSPEGFYRDSFDYERLETLLLAPLAPGGSRRYRRRAFDVESDRPVDAPEECAPADALLLFEGIFLHRPELRGHWDWSVFLEAPFEVTIGRCARRDGGDPDPSAPVNRRYVEGQRLYLRECEPAKLAALVVDLVDVANPRLATPLPPPRSVPRGPGD